MRNRFQSGVMISIQAKVAPSLQPQEGQEEEGDEDDNAIFEEDTDEEHEEEENNNLPSILDDIEIDEDLDDIGVKLHVVNFLAIELLY